MKKFLPKLINTSNGFTIIELMVVMTVIGILATLALFGLGKAQSAARDTQRQQTMTGIQTALERYYGDLGYYPNTGFSGLFAASGNNSIKSWGYVSSNPTDSKCTGAISGSGNWVPCTPTALPTYQYLPGSCTAGGCQSYQLVLMKESGGPGTIFQSPN